MGCTQALDNKVYIKATINYPKREKYMYQNTIMISAKIFFDKYCETGGESGYIEKNWFQRKCSAFNDKNKK